MSNLTLTDIRHPNYLYNSAEWLEWRYTYSAGDEFVNRYLQKFSTREDTNDFNDRKSLTPIPGFAKAAVNDVRNAIYQRMHDVTRRGGSINYQLAVQGNNGGVDLEGTGMDAFLGFNVLTELLVMGRVGVYVDSPTLTGPSVADTEGIQPYLYMYQIEDILSWKMAPPSHKSEYKSILLRDRIIDYNAPLDSLVGTSIELPCGETERYRLVWINDDTGKVNVQFYDLDSQPINPETGLDGDTGPIELNLDRIPFVMFNIGSSLLKDVSKHQIALLNLTSSDVAYALKSNFTFYTEQADLRSIGSHLKMGQSGDNTASGGGQGGLPLEAQVGVTQGRAYAMGADRPMFINPSSEPLEASMKLQEKLEDGIRKLVNLAVSNKTGRPISGDSKEMDNQGLEAGLSFIGLVLETGERKISSYWSAYESITVESREIALISYPARYSLKKDVDRVLEAEKLSTLMTTIPGRKIKRELAQVIVATLLAGKISAEDLEDINTEIKMTGYTTSDPEIIIKATEAGLVGEQTASKALGFDDDEYLIARKDHEIRIRRIKVSQTQGEGAGMEQARGDTDFSVDPKTGEDEKIEAKDTTLSDTKNKPVRGEGK